MKKLLLLLSGLVLAIFLLMRQEESAAVSSLPEPVSGAWQALNLFGAQRVYPFKELPAQAHYAAFEQVKQLRARRSSKTQPVAAWKKMGPNNLGGRTLALAFNPQNPATIYAGSASGGLWRSYSAGKGAAAWEYVATGYPVLGVSSIALAPNDSNTIYIGTGEVYNYANAGTGAAYRSTRGSYGIGILKSSDGGASWSKSLDWSYNQQRGVWAVEVNPLNPNTVWAATTEGIYKSTDAGASWVQLLNVVMATDLVINAADTNMVFAGCGNFSSAGKGIYRTLDGGESWVQLLNGLPTTFNGKIMLDITRLPFGNTVYASIGNGFSFTDGFSWLCSSVDFGDNWTVQTTQDYSQWQGWYSHDVAVNPTNALEVYAIGIAVHKSTNGGGNLTQKSANNPFSGQIPPEGPEGPPQYSHSDHHAVVFHPADPLIVYFANDGGVFRTVDGGATFESCNGGYQTGQFYGGFSSSNTDSLLAMGGLQDNSTAIYDGQQSWRVRLIGGDGAWTAIDYNNPDLIYGSSQGLNVLKSANRGAQWSGLGVPGSNRISVFISPYLLAPSDPQIIYAGRDIVYRTEDGGSSWTATNNGNPLDGNPVLAMAVSAQNSEVLYVATAPFARARGVHRSLNGGNSWSEITGSLPDRYPADLAVDPNDPGTVYITFYGFGVPHVFRSGDFGSNWQDISSGLPDVPTAAVVVDPLYPDHVYIGNDIGVFVSLDGGANWSDFSEELPDAVLVMDLSVSPVNRKLRVATHGNGAYERPLIEGAVGIAAESSGVPTGFALEQNAPNPFNPGTAIPFEIKQREVVSLRIYNSLGQEVRTLLYNEEKDPGRHQVYWDGRDNDGRPAASGVYLYRLSAGKASQVRRMILTK